MYWIRSELDPEEKRWLSAIAFIIAILIMALLAFLAFNYFFPSRTDASLGNNKIAANNYIDTNREIWIEIEKNNRQFILDEWFSDAQEIANANELDMLDFLKQIYFIVAPDFSNTTLENFTTVVLSDHPPKDGIGILILTTKETSQASDWFDDGMIIEIGYAEKLSGVFFTIIIIHDSPLLSREEKGEIFLEFLQEIFFKE